MYLHFQRLIHKVPDNMYSADVLEHRWTLLCKWAINTTVALNIDCDRCMYTNLEGSLDSWGVVLCCLWFDLRAERFQLIHGRLQQSIYACTQTQYLKKRYCCLIIAARSLASIPHSIIVHIIMACTSITTMFCKRQIFADELNQQKFDTVQSGKESWHHTSTGIDRSLRSYYCCH